MYACALCATKGSCGKHIGICGCTCSSEVQWNVIAAIYLELIMQLCDHLHGAAKPAGRCTCEATVYNCDDTTPPPDPDGVSKLHEIIHYQKGSTSDALSCMMVLSPSPKLISDSTLASVWYT